MLPSIISETGRALMPDLKNLSKEQLFQKFQDGAGTQLSIMDMIQLKNEYDRLKNAQPAPPPPTQTVADELMQAVGSGIGQIPVSNVGNEADYARGGIVAFAAGSPGPIEADAAYLRQIEEQARRLRAMQTPGTKANPADFGLSEADLGRKFTPPNPETGIKAKAAQAKGFLNKPITASGLGRIASTAGKFYVPAALGSAAGIGTVPTENVYEDLKPQEFLGIPYGFPEKDQFGNDIWPEANTPEEEFRKDLLARSFGAMRRGFTLGLAGPDADPVKAEEAKSADATLLPDNIDELMASLEETDGVGGIDLNQYMINQDMIDSAFGPLADYANKLMVARTPKDRADLEQEVRDRYKETGIGKGAKDYAEYLAKQESELDKDMKEGKWLVAADAFFRMAQAASEPGATFMGAAAEGAVRGSEKYAEFRKDMERLQNEYAKSKFELSQVQEAVEKNIIDEGGTLHKESIARHDAAENQILSIYTAQAGAQLNAMGQNLDAATKLKVAEVMSAARKVGGKYEAIVTKLAVDAFKTKDPKERDKKIIALQNFSKITQPMIYGPLGLAMYENENDPVAARMRAIMGGQQSSTGRAKVLGVEE